MSNEISRNVANDNEYFKIANFVYYVLYLNENTKNADGVMYPSVPAEGGGFNVVLKKESADKKIEFDKAATCYLAKKKDRSYLLITSYSTNDSKKGVFTYIPKKIEEDEKKMYERYAKGLDFIN